MDQYELSRKSYDIINNKAQSNSFIQGLSGLGGFPWTLLADGVTLFTHYLDMINNIRKLYGRKEVSEKEISSILGGLSSKIVVDIMADKIAGNIPIIGIYFNAICAKTMTWRIGILMTMLSARGESIDDVAIKISAWVTDTFMDAIITSALKRGVSIKILYGIGNLNGSNIIKEADKKRNDSTDTFAERLKNK